MSSNRSLTEEVERKLKQLGLEDSENRGNPDAFARALHAAKKAHPSPWTVFSDAPRGTPSRSLRYLRQALDGERVGARSLLRAMLILGVEPSPGTWAQFTGSDAPEGGGSTRQLLSNAEVGGRKMEAGDFQSVTTSNPSTRCMRQRQRQGVLLMTTAVVALAALTIPFLTNVVAPQEDANASKTQLVHDQLAKAVDEYNEICEAAEAEFRAVLDAEAEKLKTDDFEERLEQRALLERQVEDFLEKQTEPDNKTVRKASEKFHKTVQEAAEECFEAHTDAARRLGKMKEDEAGKQVLEQRDELLVRSPYWLPPIPPHVQTNINSLRDHRPAFTGGELKPVIEAVTRAARGKDRLRFRRAVDQAIEATRATRRADEPRGCPNCRSDIIAVLEKLRAGEWDLRTLSIHYRDHREQKKHVGLPGVQYR